MKSCLVSSSALFCLLFVRLSILRLLLLVGACIFVWCLGFCVLPFALRFQRFDSA